MEDDTLKTLFDEFNPQLSSDALFMEKLQSKMATVEFIKEHSIAVRKKNNRAVFVAAVAGFVVGFVFSLTLPYLTDAIYSWQASRPELAMLRFIAEYPSVISWLIIGATSVFAAVNAYELTCSLMRTNHDSALQAI